MLTSTGAGAGQSIEDGYILARVLQDYLQHSWGADDLEPHMHLYQHVRVPRAQRAQATARQAGDVYEMQTDDMIGKDYADCLAVVRAHLKDRMKWVWSENLDEAYETAREDFRKSH
jgi:salicylate hydroxylase